METPTDNPNAQTPANNPNLRQRKQRPAKQTEFTKPTSRKRSGLPDSVKLEIENVKKINLGRIGWGCELSQEYWRCGVGYCEMAEADYGAPTLFDLAACGMEVVKV